MAGGQRGPGATDWHPAKDLITYLTVLFDPSEYVGYVTETFKGEDGRQVPSKGNYDRTAGQLIDALRTCKDDIGAVLGDSDPDVGAWIRFNPLDGKGVKNENVTAFRYALVESDEMNLEEQHAMIRELELPVAAWSPPVARAFMLLCGLRPAPLRNTAPAWTTSMRCVRRTA